MTHRTALVTDATHFVGVSSATALKAAGYEVLCHDTSFTEESARSAFEAEHDGLIASPAQSAEELKADADTKLGPLDVLVHNDAFPAKRMPIGEGDPAHLREALEVMVVNPFDRTRVFAPDMVARGSGKFIFVTSATVVRGLSNYAPYVTARGGATVLAKSLAVELASKNVQVNVIAPNFVESPTYFPPSLLEDPAVAKKLLSNIPMGRLGKQSEVAAAVVFLASPEADFITGQTIAISGGWA